jgi:2-keto-4-pentenoate hydratase/2-oxohepta-3-ene-1,7-dioic acid hydratase in catechol pathway
VERTFVRVVRVEYDGAIRYAIAHADSAQVDLLAGDPFTAADRDQVIGTVPLDACRLLVPVEPTKILAVGRNYAAHAAEMNLELGAVPSVFIKPLQTLVPHGGQVVLPDRALSTKVQHEGELAVVIGAVARNVRKEDVGGYILGYTCADDVSARDLQKSDPQITRGKGFDTFCPLGPHVETDVTVAATYEVTCTVNGQLRQKGTTDDMIFDIPTQIEFLSAFTTLVPGDVILTGSPVGTGDLVPGDEVEVSIGGVAALRHSVVAYPG